MERVLVLGLGNLILGDDGLGILLVRLLRKEGIFPENVDFEETEESGLGILEIAGGYDRLILIDSIQSIGNLPQGTIIDVTEGTYSNLSGWGSHYIGFFEMKKLAEMASIPFPSELNILGINIDDPFRIDFNISEGIRKILPEIQEKLEDKIRELCCRKECGQEKFDKIH